MFQPHFVQVITIRALYLQSLCLLTVQDVHNGIHFSIHVEPEVQSQLLVDLVMDLMDSTDFKSSRPIQLFQRNFQIGFLLAQVTEE